MKKVLLALAVVAGVAALVGKLRKQDSAEEHFEEQSEAQQHQAG